MKERSQQAKIEGRLKSDGRSGKSCLSAEYNSSDKGGVDV